jgi:hypothetical protein
LLYAQLRARQVRLPPKAAMPSVRRRPDQLPNIRIVPRFVSAGLAAYKKLPTSSVYAPTAVLLPCTHFVSKGLSAGEVTDFDLRISIFGTADSVAYAWPSSVRRSSAFAAFVRAGRRPSSLAV